MRVLILFLLLVLCVAIEKQTPSLRGKDLSETSEVRNLKKGKHHKKKKGDKKGKKGKKAKKGKGKSDRCEVKKSKGKAKKKGKGKKSSKGPLKSKGKGKKSSKGPKKSKGKGKKSSKGPLEGKGKGKKGSKGKKSSKSPGNSSKAPKAKGSKGGKGGKGGKGKNSNGCVDCASDVAREEDIIEVITELSGDVDSLQGAQSKAFQWLIDSDKETNACEDEIKILQRYTLAVFYYSTGGPDWTMDTNWLNPDIDECSWMGVTCESGEITGLKLGKLLDHFSHAHLGTKI
jgi:hypothetical protein